jgi:MtN3 and saliva related transmembrane protein
MTDPSPAPWTEWLGHVAGTLTTLAFVPQVVRVLRTRQTRDISLAMFLLFVIGVALWLVYGLQVGAVPVVLANGATLVLALVILVCKLRFG